jgi:hypothetical protein
MTLMYARDTSGASYVNSGNRDGFHAASHHSNARIGDCTIGFAWEMKIEQ